MQFIRFRPNRRKLPLGGTTRPGGGILPLPPHLAQGKRTSFTPWQLVQRSLPSPAQVLQTATAWIDFARAARCSFTGPAGTGFALNALTALSKNFFFACAVHVRA